MYANLAKKIIWYLQLDLCATYVVFQIKTKIKLPLSGFFIREY